MDAGATVDCESSGVAGSVMSEKNGEMTFLEVEEERGRVLDDKQMVRVVDLVMGHKNPWTNACHDCPCCKVPIASSALEREMRALGSVFAQVLSGFEESFSVMPLVKAVSKT